MKKTSGKEPPNILLIMADDMGYSDLGCYGGEIPTPHIDQLAKKGVSFTQFYNAARCCPSRAALLSGVYPHEAGMGHQNKDRGIPSYQGRLTTEVSTIAEQLAANGYRTMQIGKWHVGDDRNYWPDKKGFHEFFTLISGAMNYYNQWPWIRSQDTIEISYNGADYQTSKGFYATDAFTDSTISFIQRSPEGKPWFLYLAYNAPHWPLHAPQEDIDLFRGKYLEGWNVIRKNRLSRMKELGIIEENTELSERFHTVPAWDSLAGEEKRNWDEKMALYAAVMKKMDDGIGRIGQYLEASGELDNTYVIFLSDNGACDEEPVPDGAKWVSHPLDGKPGSERSFPSYHAPWANVSNTPFRYFKSYLHEGGIATPLIVSGPDVVEGEINQATLGHIIDLFPTILDITDTEYASVINDREVKPLRGTSLRPGFSNTSFSPERTLFWEHQYHRAIRKVNWKMVSAHRVKGREQHTGKWELYNLNTDPTELNDLSQDYPTMVDSLATEYAAWAESVHVIKPESGIKLR